MTLRWYQVNAVQSVFDYFREKDGSPCVVLPTGSGKTHVIAELCRQTVAWGGRALVLAHVRELLEQSREKLSLYLPSEMVGVYSAGLNERKTDAPVIVAGIQSVYHRAEELGPFFLIVVDEAHLIPPEGCGRYRTFLEEEKKVSPKARLVGLTATPYRLGSGWITRDRASQDDKSERLLDEIVFEVPVVELISDGTLSSLISKGSRSALDLSKIHTVRGDFDEGEVEKLLDRRSILDPICNEIVEKTRERKKVLIFCNRVASAKKVAQKIRPQDADHDAVVVDGSTSARDRDEIVRRFRGEESANLFGEISTKPLKYVCNCGVFTTGFDAPNVDCVVLIRPTKSLALYQQMVGRGLRRAPEKHDCLVLDFGGNIDRHGPLDMPRVESGVESQTKKTWRECSECRSFVSYAYKVCPICGFVFQRNAVDPNAGLTAKASKSELLGEAPEPTVEEYDVTGVLFSEHYKKDDPDKPPTFQVEYRRGEFSRSIREWLCVEHSSAWARKRFVKWWSAKSKVAPPPTTELAVLWAQNGALATPTRIRATTRPGTFFPEIEWLEASEIPDFDPNDVKDPDEEFYNEFEEFSRYDEEESEGVDVADRRDDDGKNFEIRELYAVPQSCPPVEKKTVRCKDCGEWNDYGLDDFSGFCRAYNVQQNGTSPACSDSFKVRWIDPDVPF